MAQLIESLINMVGGKRLRAGYHPGPGAVRDAQFAARAHHGIRDRRRFRSRLCCRRSLAPRLGGDDFVFKGSLVGGMRAADPHPGNYVFQDDGRVVFLDYGCIQVLDDVRRDKARAVHRAAMARDSKAFRSAALDSA